MQIYCRSLGQLSRQSLNLFVCVWCADEKYVCMCVWNIEYQFTNRIYFSRSGSSSAKWNIFTLIWPHFAWFLARKSTKTYFVITHCQLWFCCRSQLEAEDRPPKSGAGSETDSAPIVIVIDDNQPRRVPLFLHLTPEEIQSVVNNWAGAEHRDSPDPEDCMISQSFSRLHFNVTARGPLHAKLTVKCALATAFCPLQLFFCCFKAVFVLNVWFFTSSQFKKT